MCKSSCPIKRADRETVCCTKTYLLDNKVPDDHVTLHMAASLSLVKGAGDTRTRKGTLLMFQL